MINQLFNKPISDDLLKKVLSCFSLSSLEDSRVFSKYDMELNNTIDCIYNIKDELKKVYIPCKAKIYLENITIKRCITILRQIVKLYGYNVKSCERSITKKKYIAYQLVPINKTKKVKIIKKKILTIHFD